jgi:hypothetical protein
MKKQFIVLAILAAAAGALLIGGDAAKVEAKPTVEVRTEAMHCFCNPYKWETAPPHYGQWVATCVSNGTPFYVYGAGGSPDFCSYCPVTPC